MVGPEMTVSDNQKQQHECSQTMWCQTHHFAERTTTRMTQPKIGLASVTAGRERNLKHNRASTIVLLCEKDNGASQFPVIVRPQNHCHDD